MLAVLAQTVPQQAGLVATLANRSAGQTRASVKSAVLLMLVGPKLDMLHSLLFHMCPASGTTALWSQIPPTPLRITVLPSSLLW